MRVLHCVDAHAEGEPSRIVVGGVLDVPGTTMLEKMQLARGARATSCGGCCCSSRAARRRCRSTSSCPSSHPEADAGFLIMESCSYEGMSGSNTINTATVLLETGIVPMTEPVTELVLEAPAGLVRVTADCRDGRCERVTFENVPSFATHLDAPRRRCRGSASCGSTSPTAARSARSSTPRRSATRSCPEEARALADLGERIRPAVAEQLEIAHPVEPALEHPLVRRLHRRAARRAATPATPPSSPPAGSTARATGTATSARLAVLAARGLIGDGEDVRQRERDRHAASSAGSSAARRSAASDAIVPAISGRAWITGTHQFVLDPDDPFPEGFRLSDTWGAGL